MVILHGVFIGYQSALEYWQKALAEEALAGKKVRACKITTVTLDAKELREVAPWNLSLPLHVLVGSKGTHKERKSLKRHFCSGVFPDGSFIKADNGLIVSSPELCFVQMASELSFVELVLLGFELCGSYRLDRTSELERGFRDDQPLTSTAKLASYLAKAKGLKGCVNAQKALRYIADNSASPMESNLTILLTFPYRLGGFGFSMPLLNYPVRIPSDVHRKEYKPTLFCDLFWPDVKVDVEYDSDSSHTASEKIARDSIRRNSLSSVGITVITVTKRQVYSTSELRKAAETLSRLLKKRLKCSKRFPIHHATLHRQLLIRMPEAQYFGTSLGGWRKTEAAPLPPGR